MSSSSDRGGLTAPQIVGVVVGVLLSAVVVFAVAALVFRRRFRLQKPVTALDLMHSNPAYSPHPRGARGIGKLYDSIGSESSANTYENPTPVSAYYAVKPGNTEGIYYSVPRDIPLYALSNQSVASVDKYGYVAEQTSGPQYETPIDSAPINRPTYALQKELDSSEIYNVFRSTA